MCSNSFNLGCLTGDNWTWIVIIAIILAILFFCS